MGCQGTSPRCCRRRLGLPTPKRPFAGVTSLSPNRPRRETTAGYPKPPMVGSASCDRHNSKTGRHRWQGGLKKNRNAAKQQQPAQSRLQAGRSKGHKQKKREKKNRSDQAAPPAAAGTAHADRAATGTTSHPTPCPHRHERSGDSTHPRGNGATGHAAPTTSGGPLAPPTPPPTTPSQPPPAGLKR